MAAITFLMSSLARLRVSARTERPDMAPAAPATPSPQHPPPLPAHARARPAPPSSRACCVTTLATPGGKGAGKARRTARWHVVRLRGWPRPPAGYAVTQRRGDAADAAIFLWGKSRPAPGTTGPPLSAVPGLRGLSPQLPSRAERARAQH